MTALDEYLKEEWLADRRELEEISRCAARTLKMFVDKWDTSGGWPYKVGGDASGPSHSKSTNAMITHALNALLDPGSTILAPIDLYDETLEVISNRGDAPALEDIQKLVKDAREHCEATLKNSDSSGETDADIILCKSATFGLNDPFTLCWWRELKVEDDRIEKVVEQICQRLVTNDLAQPLEFPDQGKKNSKISYKRAFPLLRICQLLDSDASNSENKQTSMTMLKNYFSKTLHEHLSFFMIPDSRFDPATLVFSLEGMVMFEKTHVDHGTIERTLSILKDLQRHNPYWRPVAPFAGNDAGAVSYPVSVEIANSLLRLFSRLDEGQLHDTYFERFGNLLRRYREWVFARLVEVPTSDDSKPPYCGWHSEHVDETESIHLWETSQVLLFLVHYSALLRRHVARKLLVSAKVELRRPREKSLSGWKNYLKLDPIQESQTLSCYASIDRHFIAPRIDPNLQANYSFLLYGPPGTGKTTVATELADALGYRLVTITASDFLAAGHAEIEARTKSVFTTLESQTETVILFDEMDHFLLDRESRLYRDQETEIQLMTPGMLTKINDLRKRENAIFIIATNFAERIDPAIKRVGRIDQQLMLLPPERSVRLNIVKGQAQKKGRVLTDDQLSQSADNSALLTWKEIDRVLDEESNADSLPDAFEQAKREITLKMYKSRFLKPEDKPQLPLQEFLCVWAIKLEPEDSGPLNEIKAGESPSKELIERALRAAQIEGEDTIAAIIRNANRT